MKYRALGNTGMRLSVIGMGGSGYGNVYGKYDESEAINGVQFAIDKGINYIDTAPWYGQGLSETFLGKALKSIPRSSFYIGTKVGRYERDVPKMFDFSAKRVQQSAKESLERLQLTYVDILQIHDIEFAPSQDIIVNETLPALKELQEQGLCRFIGITGYPLGVLRETAQRSYVKIGSVLSYSRLTLNDSSLIKHFEFYQSHGIGLINASPVGMGLLTHAGVQPWHPASEEIKDACKKAVTYCDTQGVDVSKLATNFSCNFEEVSSGLIRYSIHA